MKKKAIVGRPTKYSEDILKKTQEYIDSCADVVYDYHKTRGDKSDSYEEKVNVKLPSIEGLAVHLDVSRTCLYEWKDVYPEFSYIFDKLLLKQASMLLQNGLSGRYNSTIAKVILTKHGYRDENGIVGKDGEALRITFDPTFNREVA